MSLDTRFEDIIDERNHYQARCRDLLEDIAHYEQQIEDLERAVHTRDEIINELRERLKVREINKVGDFIEMSDAGEKAMEGSVAVQS